MKSLSGKEVCKLLESEGWKLRRVTGSHHIYTKPGHTAWVSVPVHRNQALKKTTLRNILKIADLLDKV